MEHKTMDAKYECFHEELLQDHTLKITTLEQEVQFKKEKIDSLQTSMKEINEKMDKLSEDVNKAIKESIKDDNDIDKRVTSLENTVSILKWITTLLFGSGVIWIVINMIK